MKRMQGWPDKQSGIKSIEMIFSNIDSSCLKRMQNNMALERFAAKT